VVQQWAKSRRYRPRAISSSELWRSILTLDAALGKATADFLLAASYSVDDRFERLHSGAVAGVVEI
jgi:hypothetical protein